MEIEKEITKEVEVVLKTTFNEKESEVRLTSNNFSGNKRLISILIDEEISEYFSSEEEYLIELGNFASKVRFSGIVPEEPHHVDIISELGGIDQTCPNSPEEKNVDIEDLDSLIDEGFLPVEESKSKLQKEEITTDFVSDDKKKKDKKSKKEKEGKKDKKKKKKDKSGKTSEKKPALNKEEDDAFAFSSKRTATTPLTEEKSAVEDNDFFKNMEEFENQLTGGYEARVDLPDPTLEYVKKLKDEQGSDALKEYLAKLTQTQKESLAALVAASKK